MITREPWGTTPEGDQVARHVIESGRLAVTVSDWGALLTSILVPDARGVRAEVTLGFDDLASYLQPHPYFGATVGRYANRIAGGRFTLDGTDHQLTTNDGPHHLHGGWRGFDRRRWHARAASSRDGGTVVLTRQSPHDEEGYPGTLDVEVHVTVEGDALTIEYRAETDRPTLVNLTQHAYVDLSAGAAPTIEAHRLWIRAERFVPVDARLIPLGETRPVADTPFDFREPRLIGGRIDDDDPQLRAGLGYDHCWLLDTEGDESRTAARLEDASTGRWLEVTTSEPGLQFYSGNQLDGTTVGRGGRRHASRTGLCLETQHLPDSPNHPAFPSTVLRPGERYHSRTTWRFGAAGGSGD